MSDDPFTQIMRDRGLGDPETDTDDVQSPALPADYVARVRALELATRSRTNPIPTARAYLAFLTDRENLDDPKDGH